MNRINQDLIEQMASELQPVRPLKMRDGLLLVALAALATVLLVEVFVGLWAGVLQGQASAFFMIANGLLLVLGIASATSVVTMASPRVGNRHDAPKWTMAMAGVLPVAALITLAAQQSEAELLGDSYGLHCTGAALVASILTASALLVWLRRGAPVSLNTAGLHLGVAAGALGSAAYGLACPLDGIVHLGIFHVAPVVIAGLVGRFAVPRLLRW
jgi:hypothetical protein